MPDAILTRDGPVAVPQDYTVPNGGELLPLTVRATIDGTGAASSFYAAVQVIAPSGRLMGTYITKIIAAGASADVTWFPGVSDIESVLPLPGQILQQYFGLGTASDFTWSTNNVETSSGYPSNNTFNKISPTSKLLITANADFIAGTTVPNVYAMGLWIDGNLEENIFADAADSGTIKSIAWAKFTSTTFTAGAHTLDMKVWFLNGGGTWTLKCGAGPSIAVDLSILEVAV